MLGLLARRNKAKLLGDIDTSTMAASDSGLCHNFSPQSMQRVADRFCKFSFCAAENFCQSDK